MPRNLNKTIINITLFIVIKYTRILILSECRQINSKTMLHTIFKSDKVNC